MSPTQTPAAPIWRAAIPLAVFTAGAAAAAEPSPRAAEPSPPAARSALAVVGRMLNVLGGADAPYRVDAIGFTFSVERDGKIAGSRRHVWHPKSGRHELWYTRSQTGDEVHVDWNIHRREGRATVGGEPLAGAELESQLEAAARMWVNDTYWLLMPYKLVDPGVDLAYAGEYIIDGRAFDKIEITFDGVGFTPGDTYWAYIARDSGRMERWAYVLEGREGPAVEWKWLDHAHYGPLLLAPRKERVGAAQAILTHRIEVR